MEQVRYQHQKTQNPTVKLFKKNICNQRLKQIQNSILRIHNPVGFSLFIRLKLGLRYLRAHKHKVDFQYTIDLFCNILWM